MPAHDWLSQRMLFIYGAALCLALMATALVLQYSLNLEPCPLCIVQRVLVTGLGVVMLVAAVHNPQGLATKFYGAVTVLIAVAGMVVAGRHVWLQHLPADEVPACGPGLQYMLDAFPLNETFAMVFKGSGECAQVQWRFIGLSIPEWTLIIFVGICAFGMHLMVRKKTS